jgi:hypothetical protein
LPTIGARQALACARGGPVEDPTPALERGRVPLVADGTYLGPVKGRRRLDVRVVNASA